MQSVRVSLAQLRRPAAKPSPAGKQAARLGVKGESHCRRVLLAGAGSGLALAGSLLVAAALGGGAAMAAADPNRLVRSGMDKFRANDVEGSLADFDAALAARPAVRPYLWQRGLSLYYLQQYEQGAQQFRDDVAVNPNDTEEAIWAFLCEAQLVGPEEARRQFLKVGRDGRRVMRAAEECFRTGAAPSAILAAAGGDEQGHDAFYSRLYVGLWHEAQGEAAAAREAIVEAVRTAYGQQSGDYMAALAAVHCQRRGWQT